MTRDSQSAHESLRAQVSAADRQRRRRDTARLVWRVAPLAAAVCLLIALAVRLTGAPPLITVLIIAVLGAAIGAVLAASRRPHDVSDREAAVIDAQAALEGELRSAHWFAHNDKAGERDPWIEFHLARAAARIEAIDWNGIYPALTASREKAATVLLVIAALIVAVGIPGRGDFTFTGQSSAAARTAAKQATPAIPATAAELFNRLQAILGEAEAGNGRALSADEIRGLLAALDKMKASEANPGGKDDGAKKKMTEADLKAMADRAKRASESDDLEPTVRDALADMSNKLSDAATAQNAQTKQPKDASTPEEKQSGDTAQASAGGDKGDQGAQSVKEAANAGGVGVVMMSGEASASKEAGLGLGGSAAMPGGRGAMPDLAAALRKETIESAHDNEGEKTVLGERRQTEQSTATAAYARSAPAAAGRGRSTAPPTVPESRRAALRSYFIRKQ